MTIAGQLNTLVLTEYKWVQHMTELRRVHTLRDLKKRNVRKSFTVSLDASCQSLDMHFPLL